MSDGMSPLTGTLLGAPPVGGSMPPMMPPAPVPPVAGWQPGIARTMTTEDTAKWTARIDRASTFAELFHPQWDRALERYAKARYQKDRYDVNALLDFRHVETRKAQLFHRTPEVQLHPIDPEDQTIPWDQVLPLRQKYLNHQLGPHGANAKRALHQTLVDALAASGWLAILVGYENRMLPVPGAIGPDGQPQQVPVWERCFLSRISSKKVLVPDDYRSTDFDESPWLGVKGTMALSMAKRQPGWVLPADFAGTTAADTHVFDHGLDQRDASDPMLDYTLLWYRAAYFDADVWHPDLYRTLILVKGLDVPVKWCDSPFQNLDPNGQLTDDSLMGSPIHLGTLRDLPDSAYVPCDLVVGEQLSREINKFRTQVIRGRSRRQPIVMFDTQNLDKDTVDKIEKNEGPIPLPAGSLAGGIDHLIAVVQTGSEPRDNYTAQDYAERDWETALGSSANQSGQLAKSKRTATEVRNVQGNSQARSRTEEDRVREYFVALVRKFDTIEQRYATPQKVQKVLGAQGAQLWAQWRTLPGTYAYDILPDAGRHVDAQQAHADAIDEYNLFRKDSRINTEVLLKHVARSCGYDPLTFAAPPKPPQPDPVKLALSFNGQDVIMPATAQLIVDLLVQSGIKLQQSTILALMGAAAQQTMNGVSDPTHPNHPNNAHGGSADRTEPINQHQTETTGGVQGVGRAQ